MQPSRAQKILKFLSFLSIVGAVLNLGLAFMLIFGGGLYAAEGTGAEGMTAAEMGTMAAGVGMATVFEAIIGLVEGWLGLRAAMDNSKIMPVWVIAVIGLVGGFIALAMAFFGGNTSAQTVGSAVGSLAASGLMFWLANTIKTEAGK